MQVIFDSRDAPRHASPKASSHGAKWCAGHSKFWPPDPAARTIGEPGVIGAWLEPDSAQARQAILSPLALCPICGTGSGCTAQDSKPSPRVMGVGRRSIHRLLDSKRSSTFPRGRLLLVGG